DAPSVRRGGLAGIVLGLACLTKAGVMPFVVLFVAALAVRPALAAAPPPAGSLAAIVLSVVAVLAAGTGQHRGLRGRLGAAPLPCRPELLHRQQPRGRGRLSRARGDRHCARGADRRLARHRGGRRGSPAEALLGLGLLVRQGPRVHPRSPAALRGAVGPQAPAALRLAPTV